MRSRILWAALAAVLLPWIAAAQDPPPFVGPPAPETPGGDAQDLVFLGPGRPVLFRLHIRVGDRPFRVFWDEYFHSLFASLDRDGDGVLSEAEARPAPRAQNLLREMQGNHFNAIPGGAASFAELDTSPKDDRVTREELAQYYRQSGIQALRVAYQNPGGQRNQLTDALFKELDRDKDGKLSQRELEEAAVSLRKLDADDDELVAMQELLPSAFFGPALPAPAPAGMPTPAPSSPFLTLDPGDAWIRWTTPLLRRYDGNRDRKLSRAEIGLEKEAFDRLDADQDGELDSTELRRFLDRPADLAFIVRFGQSTGPDATVELYRPDGQPPPLAPAVRQSGATALKITLDTALLDVGLRGGVAANFQPVRQFYLGQFKAADADQNGAVEEKEVQPSSFQFLRGVFPLTDRDGDGQVTEAELHAYLELQAKAAASTTAVTITDHGSGLFDLWDTDRNGRLGPRELRAAWSLLSHLDRDRDGLIGRNEVPHRYELTLSQGQPPTPLVRPAPPAVAVRPPPPSTRPAPAPAKGPLWFRKMDRNGDGDVSRREFLGSAENFDRLDADGDGLIDLKEAEQAEARRANDQ